MYDELFKKKKPERLAYITATMHAHDRACTIIYVGTSRPYTEKKEKRAVLRSDRIEAPDS